jgi:hypothetical protein
MFVTIVPVRSDEGVDAITSPSVYVVLVAVQR